MLTTFLGPLDTMAGVRALMRDMDQACPDWRDPSPSLCRGTGEKFVNEWAAIVYLNLPE